MNDLIAITVSIILGVFAIVAGSLEFLERLGFPTPLERKRNEKNKKLIVATLTETGIHPFKPEFAQLSDLIRLKQAIPYSYPASSLDNLIIKYTSFIDQKLVGLFEQTRLSYYVDFMTSLSRPEDLRMLSNIMCCQIMEVMSDFSNSPINFNKIAALKSSNPALALLVSIELQKPCVFVDVRGGAILSDTVDGELENGDEVVIVHDVVASGQIILLCANELTKRNVKVNHVFALLERTDRKKAASKSPAEFLGSSGLTLHSIRKMNDQDLARLLEKSNKTQRNAP